MCETLSTSPSGFLHPCTIAAPSTTDRGSAGLLREMWRAPVLEGDQQLRRPDGQSRRQRPVVRVHRRKDPRIVKDPHGRAARSEGPSLCEKRPPSDRYYEAYNNPNVCLVDLKRTPMVQVTEEGSRRPRAGGRSTSSSGPRVRLRDRRPRRLGSVAGRPGPRGPLADGPKTFLGIQTAGFPNFFFPGAHAAPATTALQRRPGGLRDRHTRPPRDHGYDTIEVDPPRGTVDDHGRRRAACPPSGGQLLLREQHPGKPGATS